MNILMDLVNKCFETSSTWRIHALQEKSCQWADFQIKYDGSEKSIHSSNNWDRNDLAMIYWEAGLITSPSDQELQDWIIQVNNTPKVKALAPDTNLLIRGYTSNFLKRYISSPRNIPVLITIARSIQIELHTMRGFKYSRKMNEALEIAIAQSLGKWPLLQDAWKFNSKNDMKTQIAGLLDHRGRIGVRGSFELDSLHKWAPVIVVKPSHILHSPKIVESTTFLNAIHDSLIRYEIDFLKQNTSLPILLISNDKDQCKSAEQEGLNVLHIAQPIFESNTDSHASLKLSLERIRSLLLSLLGFSPAVRLTSNEGEYYLAWTWRGRQMDDITYHKIRLVKRDKQVEIITP